MAAGVVCLRAVIGSNLMNEEIPLPGSLNLNFLEELYTDYLRNPDSVPQEWQRYFFRWKNGETGPSRTAPAFRPFSIFNPPESRRAAPVPAIPGAVDGLQDRVDQLIRAYRSRGHIIAKIDPLGRPRQEPPELDPNFYGFTEADNGRLFSCETVHPQGPLTLPDLVDRLRNTYCRSIAVEYMHIADLRIRRWLQHRMEGTQNHLRLTRPEQLRILTRLTDAVTFEEFIHKKFVGAKSFSLEGSESLIPLLDLAIEKAGEQGVREIVLGMAHRGRLNVLANILGKSPRQIFREFADADPQLYVGRGDVKYHLGYSSQWKTAAGHNIHLSLCFNPSHLEHVNPVVLGRTRAKQDRQQDVQREQAMPLLIHGDAGFAGQGIVQETLNLSQLTAYTVGGTLHVVVNNQIGFTTGPDEGRSSLYATDVAKLLQIPIFHVNGEDPEAVAQAVKVAMDFRAQFKRDVVLDMYGYRRLGHNESDEPSFTQPLLYRVIEERKTVREGYLDHLLELGGLTRREADDIAEKRRALLEQALSEARREDYEQPKEAPEGIWHGFIGGPERDVPDVETGVAAGKLSQLLERQTELPAAFHPHPKIKRLLKARSEIAQGKRPLDWATAEALAFASLACEGVRVRLTGQDSGRGTFSQRHAILHDYETGETYTPLQHLQPGQASVEIANSPLSETGVLGFEYGYSLDCPEGLTLWEAQFGDFCNVPQVIIDQFIASAEDKWRRLSGLVLLLPHGFEGQGPEHSSARLERFLMLAAEDNIQVVYPSTPAQYFHCLRRQAVRPWRKPLVVMTPKSMLRHPEAVSSLEDCARGTFERILPDPAAPDPKSVRRVLLCSGKIYYELAKQRSEEKRDDVTILRIEQLYPLAPEKLEAALAPFPKDTPVVWVQEEPENMGAWRYWFARFANRLFDRHPFQGIYRPGSASPATGSHNSHKKEQEEIITAALAP